MFAMPSRRVAPALVAVLFLPSLAAAQAPPPPGFSALFNGKDLSGWHGMAHFDPRQLWAMSTEERAKFRAAGLADAKTHWRVENGEFVNDGHGVYLTSDKDYGDLELLIDYRTVPRADSGIYLRANPQVQIWDSTEEEKFPLGADKGSGGLWNNRAGAPGKDPLVKADRPFGEWNSFRILQIGDRTSVWLNGQLVVDQAPMENFWDRSKPLWARGPIQLQTHGGEIRWRNLFVREIAPEEANEQLGRGGADGFKAIFDGKDLSGWDGAVEGYEVAGGALRCRRGNGGILFHRQELGDFAARLEFRLPPGGNNGLAIRHPGWVEEKTADGKAKRTLQDTAYWGMCELQVLDNDAPQYAKLDPRQYHGSAYGMAAAQRGFLRPAGQWNYQEVTVKGSTLRVELNGTTILDADLAKVSEFMANSPHPGKDRRRGHFGFAGHGDAVEFRNVRVKTLD